MQDYVGCWVMRALALSSVGEGYFAGVLTFTCRKICTAKKWAVLTRPLYKHSIGAFWTCLIFF